MSIIQYADIVYDTIVDGLGLRNTLYVSGCSHNCPGCHNKALQDYNYGKRDNIDNIVNKLIIDNNDITLSGGEPFEQCRQLIELLGNIDLRDKYNNNPKRNIWIYSGYTFEHLILNPNQLNLLSMCDVLVDGKFDINKKDLNLKFRGSSNQRIIDVKKSLKENKVIELEL